MWRFNFKMYLVVSINVFAPFYTVIRVLLHLPSGTGSGSRLIAADFRSPCARVPRVLSCFSLPPPPPPVSVCGAYTPLLSGLSCVSSVTLFLLEVLLVETV